MKKYWCHLLEIWCTISIKQYLKIILYTQKKKSTYSLHSFCGIFVGFKQICNMRLQGVKCVSPIFQLSNILLGRWAPVEQPSNCTPAPSSDPVSMHLCVVFCVTHSKYFVKCKHFVFKQVGLYLYPESDNNCINLLLLIWNLRVKYFFITIKMFNQLTQSVLVYLLYYPTL